MGWLELANWWQLNLKRAGLDDFNLSLPEVNSTGEGD
jgi:hypothetical protein